MGNLYDISEDILRIFADVEANDGEITDEQYDALTIKQDELKTKLNNYVKAVREFENDANLCKEEKKRINDRQNVYKNRIERLKQSMLTAVLQFGERGKNNSFIELPTCRLFTRTSSSVSVDKDRIDLFMREFERYVRELTQSGILYIGDDVDLEGILSAINANCKAECGDNFEPFTLVDLLTMKITISQTASIYSLFKKGDALQLYGKDPINTRIEENTSLDDWKSAVKMCQQDNLEVPTVATIVNNENLQIK